MPHKASLGTIDWCHWLCIKPTAYTLGGRTSSAQPVQKTDPFLGHLQDISLDRSMQDMASCYSLFKQWLCPSVHVYCTVYFSFIILYSIWAELEWQGAIQMYKEAFMLPTELTYHTFNIRQWKTRTCTRNQYFQPHALHTWLLVPLPSLMTIIVVPASICTSFDM